MLTLQHLETRQLSIKFRSCGTDVGLDILHLGFPFFASGSESFAFGGPFLAHAQIFESDCEGEGDDELEVVVEGDEGAGVLDSEGVGSVDHWTTGDRDRSLSCAWEVQTSVSRDATFYSRRGDSTLHSSALSLR